MAPSKAFQNLQKDKCERKKLGLKKTTMEGNSLTKGNTRKASSHSSINAQSMKIRKSIPQVEKLRIESLPMSPLSLNGSLTTVDVCDTSFGKGVIEEMETTNADIPDASFSEEVLQDMDYSLDALREAVPVMCLKKKDDSYDDSDIFEEMSAYQVMGIFNNKDSQRRDEVSSQNDKASELKNKRLYPDKNIDNLYQNGENDDNSNRNEIECTKHPGKKIDDHIDKLDDLLQDNEKDMNNNDSECSMETTKTSANGYDEINNKEKISLSENNAYKVNSNQDKKFPKEKCQKKESLGSEEVSNKSLFDDLSHIKGDVDNMVEHSSKVKDNKHVKENDKLDLCNNEEYKKLSNKNEKKDKNIVNKDNLSNLCKKGEYKELVKKNEKKDSALTSDITESKAFPIRKDLNEHKDKNIHKNGATVQDELHDKSEFANLNDSMRQIVEDFIKQLPSSSENFLVKVEPIKECPMCYFKFDYHHFIFSIKTGVYTINCECGLIIYVLFEESLHLRKEYLSYNLSSDASTSFTTVTSLNSELETASPVILENENIDFNERSERNKRRNRTQFVLVNDSEDDSLECQDDSDDSYVP